MGVVLQNWGEKIESSNTAGGDALHTNEFQFTVLNLMWNDEYCTVAHEFVCKNPPKNLPKTP